MAFLDSLFSFLLHREDNSQPPAFSAYFLKLSGLRSMILTHILHIQWLLGKRRQLAAAVSRSSPLQPIATALHYYAVPLLRSICFVLFYLFNFTRFHSSNTKNNNSYSNYLQWCFPWNCTHIHSDMAWEAAVRRGDNLKAYKLNSSTVK